MSGQHSLKHKTVKGTAWSAIDNVANHGVTFIVGLVLARLLSPDEYGLIGLITIFISLFNVFVDSGLNSALIRKSDANDDDYNTMFIFNMVVSILLYGVLWIGAPAISNFFERGELTALTRAVGVVLIIDATALVQTTILTKEIDFKKQTKISFIASVASGIIGICLALDGLGVWSLVGQQISRGILRSAFLWIWSKWRPAIRFSVTSFNYMWGFGWKMLCSSLLDTAWKEVYQVVIGKFYQPAALGQYTRAQSFSMIFSSNLTGIVQRVSYPVLSSIQNDRERLKEAYRRVIKTTMLITFVCMLGLAAIAKSMVVVLIGEPWLSCVVMLQIICFNMMLYPLHAINLNMLKVQGRSDLFLKLEIIKKIIAVGPIICGIFWSIYAMLLGSVLTGFVAYYLNAYYSGPFLKYGVMCQVKDLLPSFGVALAMAIPVFAISFLPIAPYVLLPLQICVGALLVIAICEFSKLNEYIELKGFVNSALGKIKH